MECCRYVYLFQTADDSKLTQWMPDDAFYYLILGRNFTLLHRWTFDGIAPATGFHLLWGYFIALIYWLVPTISLHQIFTLLYFAVALLIAASLALMCALVYRVFGPFAMLGPVALFCTSLAVQQPNFLMESGLVTFFSCVAIYKVFGCNTLPPDRFALAVASGVGVLGMLSRSDFGLLPLTLLLACLAVTRRFKNQRVKLASATLAGSVLGLALLLGHTYSASGHLTQSSVRVKRRWSSLEGDSTRTSARRAVAPLFEGSEGNSGQAQHQHAAAAAAFLLFAATGAAMTKSNRRTAITLVAGTGGVVIGYIALYAYDSAAIQPWYFANYLAPFSVLAASAFAIPGKVWRTLSVLVLGVWIWKASPIRRGWTPIWPQQIGFYEAGLYVREHPEVRPVGAWNAGIDSYAAGGGVINLDGLVNDDAVQYVVSNSLKNYIAARNIQHVVDDAIMWDSDKTRFHGGYAGDVLTRCIDQKITLWQVPEPKLVGEHVLLTTLNPQCVSGVDGH